MGRPPGYGDDEEREWGTRYESDYQESFSKLPPKWQEDEYVAYYYDEMFNAQNWDEATYWHDRLDDRISEQFGEEFDDHFDWNDWRDTRDS